MRLIPLVSVLISGLVVFVFGLFFIIGSTIPDTKTNTETLVIERDVRGC